MGGDYLEYFVSFLLSFVLSLVLLDVMPVIILRILALAGWDFVLNVTNDIHGRIFSFKKT